MQCLHHGFVLHHHFGPAGKPAFLFELELAQQQDAAGQGQGVLALAGVQTQVHLYREGMKEKRKKGARTRLSIE